MSEQALAVAREVLALAPPGCEAEAIVEHVDAALTRYALNAIHQNVAESSLRIRVRLLRDGRVGVAEVRGGGDDAPGRAVTTAEEARRLAQPREDLAPLPDPDPAGEAAAGTAAWSVATAESTPEQRGDAVAVVTAAAAEQGLQAFGAVETSTRHLAIANTRGVARHARTTVARFTAVVRGDDGAGYADRHSADAGALDPAGLAAEVVDTASRAQHPRGVEPGDWEVVLSPYAVAELVDYLAWMSFNALAVQEHRSFVRPGEKLMSDSVTIREDAHDPAGLPFPFDWEGVTARSLTLVERGVCRDVVYDSPTARVDGVRSTGHSLPQPNTDGPAPRHLFVEAGDSASVEAMLGGVRRGLYVTRFWYVREVHPLRTVLTGMTREGTFLIEKGRLAGPVRDLRFTQSVVDALADVRAVSRERRLEVPEGGAATLAPWLHLGRFHFSS